MAHNPNSYFAPVFSLLEQPVTAFLGPALEQDLPEDWECDWRYIWQRTDFECQAIIKISVEGNLWGLMRYGLYPYPFKKPKLRPEFLLLENLEAHPARQPSEKYAFKKGPPSPPNPYINPVGKWLIWYACQTALESCNLETEPLIALEAKPDAVDYYRDIIGMTMIDTVTSSFGEDSYAFSLNRNPAEDFCTRQRTEYGDPRQAAAE
jgi:hypothetical protein